MIQLLGFTQVKEVPIREGTNGGIYYECPNSYIRSYMKGKRLLSCKFFDGRHKFF